MANRVIYALLWILSLLTFFIVFIPIGGFLRIIKRDPLQKSIDKAKMSYWLNKKL